MGDIRRPVNLQRRFFQKLFAISGLSKKEFIARVAAILCKSAQSVYKKISGEVGLTLEETEILTRHFQVSFDELVENNNRRSIPILKDIDNYEDYINFLEAQFQNYGERPDLEVWYFAQEMFSPYYFLSSKLAAFKLYYWGKNVWNMNLNKFHFNSIKPEILKKCGAMGQAALHIKTNEFYHDRTLIHYMKEIEIILSKNLFSRPEDALEITHNMKSLWFHLKRMIINGQKYDPFTEERILCAPLNVYLMKDRRPDDLTLVRAKELQFVYKSIMYPTLTQIYNIDICEKVEETFNLLLQEGENLRINKSVYQTYVQNVEKKIMISENRIKKLIHELNHR